MKKKDYFASGRRVMLRPFQRLLFTFALLTTKFCIAKLARSISFKVKRKSRQLPTFYVRLAPHYRRFASLRYAKVAWASASHVTSLSKTALQRESKGMFSEL